MTMKQLMRKLAKNAVQFATVGDLPKATVCLDLLQHMRESNMDTIKGKLELLVDNPAESV
jgi:hypothetical protein